MRVQRHRSGAQQPALITAGVQGFEDGAPFDGLRRQAGEQLGVIGATGCFREFPQGGTAERQACFLSQLFQALGDGIRHVADA